jgi:hypothetical protein
MRLTCTRVFCAGSTGAGIDAAFYTVQYNTAAILSREKMTLAWACPRLLPENLKIFIFFP